MLVFAFAAAGLAAQDASPSPFYGAIDDHSAARLKFQSAVISAAPKAALAYADKRVEGPAGATHVWVRQEGDAFKVRFTALAPGESPSPGDVSFRRTLDKGLVTSISIDLDPSMGSYALLTSRSGDSSFLQLYGDSGPLSDRVSLRSPLFYLFTAPLSKIASLAGESFPWDLAFAPPAQATAIGGSE
jgi:hypothetical protein